MKYFIKLSILTEIEQRFQTHFLSIMPRMNRADEKPTIERLGEDSLSNERIKWVEPIDEAFIRYGQELGDHSGLSLGFDQCVNGQPIDNSDVRFDKEF